MGKKSTVTWRGILALGLLVASMSAAGAQEPEDVSPRGEGAFLFAYRPHSGARSDFDRGYRAHLDWHVEQGDPLPWYAWDVLAGPGMGNFVDGTFGIPFSALDARVDPAGDARDAAANVLPHAEPVLRELLRLRRGLSSAAPLEGGSPTPLVQVVRYSVPPGLVSVVEDALLRLQEAGEATIPYTVYEHVAGGAGTGFVLMVWREGMGSFDDSEANPERRLREHLARSGTAAAVQVRSELWRFRADLTHVPETRRKP